MKLSRPNLQLRAGHPRWWSRRVLVPEMATTGYVPECRQVAAVEMNEASCSKSVGERSSKQSACHQPRVGIPGQNSYIWTPRCRNIQKASPSGPRTDVSVRRRTPETV
jgi:hypothetical protein